MQPDMNELLGLPLQDALTRCEALGIVPEVITSTAPPARGREPDRRECTPRVVRVQGTVLTVCAFPDGMPRMP